MLTFGADPEIFATTSDGVISPAILAINEQLDIVLYDEKHPVFYIDDHFSWMMDGVAFEVTLLEPHKNYKSLFTTLNESYSKIKDIIENLYFNGEQLKFSPVSAIKINKNIYKNLWDIPLIWQGFIFGCDRDWDAFNPEYDGNEIDVRNHQYRYGAGHFHIGTDDPNLLNKMHEESSNFVKLLAVFLGNTAVVNSAFPELDRIRTFHYGKPGKYRPQLWGIEYRTPSNGWTLSEKGVYEMVNAAEMAVSRFEKNQYIEIIKNFCEKSVENILNVDIKNAAQVLQEVM